MLASVATLATVALLASNAVAAPVRLQKKWVYSQYFDLQGHRGGRGETVENTLPSFAWGLIDGVTSLEMDVAITKDGEAVVTHDESVLLECRDTVPAFANDPLFPYVGKFVANLTLAQIKTLDCGTQRLVGFPLQQTYSGTKMSTLQEMFSFVKCATDEPVLFNIESKVDGDYRNLTRSAEDFARIQLEVFKAQGADVVDRITYQSFDWRTLILSKKMMPELRTSALFDDTTLYKPINASFPGTLAEHGKGASNWLAGIDIDTFNGSTIQERAVQAAYSIGADFISPVATSYSSPVPDVSGKGFVPFTTKAMVDLAHKLGMGVKPWTSNYLSLSEYLLSIGVDGIITDYPTSHRRMLVQKGYKVAPKGNETRILGCLAKLNQIATNLNSTRPY